MFDSSDLLHGARGIGECLGMDERDVYYLIESTDMPVFRVGRKIFARRSQLDEWFRPRPGNSGAPAPSPRSDGPDGGGAEGGAARSVDPPGRPHRRSRRGLDTSE